ncbi:MAG: lysophospholipid acyltransferase family protein [Microscillaceae bacterium]|nr:lysophospholipid acyltransferase family protein [Microscillaceae bacterium]
MVRLLQWTYFIWVAFWFWLGFIILYPYFLMIIPFKKWHKYYYFPSKMWAYMFYTMIGIPVKTIRHFKPAKGQMAVYCPNHFSYLDIPILTLTMPSFFVFVGLHDLEKIPLFGYFYRNIHITVNRGNLRNRYETYQKAQKALDEGKSLVMFPEGGIWSEDFPRLAPFKDGPFRVAIEKQVPIVPVTIPYNWRFMPLLDVKKLRWHRQEVIFHQAIDTKGMTLKDLPALKAQTYEVIDRQLKELC